MKKYIVLCVCIVGIIGTAVIPNLFAESEKVEAKEETTERNIELTEKQVVVEPVEKRVKRGLIQFDGVAQGETPPPHAYTWVSDMVDEMSKPNTEVDKGYNMYVKSQEVRHVVGKYRVEGIALQSDFTNLLRLSAKISHGQFVRTSHLDPNGQAMDKTEFADQWKLPSEDMEQSYEYMKQILRDLDVAFNKNGNEETYGVTHALEGNKANEIDSFIEGESVTTTNNSELES